MDKTETLYTTGEIAQCPKFGTEPGEYGTLYHIRRLASLSGRSSSTEVLNDDT